VNFTRTNKVIPVKIQPLLKDCKFSINSTTAFTDDLKKLHQNTVDFTKQPLLTQSLFTSINVSKVVDFIIEKKYEQPDLYFGENDSETFPPQLVFKEFLIGVIVKFSAFSTLNGYYRQKEGLSMGSKLSPALSNIFLNMMEMIIIEKFIDQNILLFYCRYVDDCLLLVRKRYKNVILEKMNAFDPFLKFTAVEMSESDSRTTN
jgi:hypothetical protein